MDVVIGMPGDWKTEDAERRVEQQSLAEEKTEGMGRLQIERMEKWSRAAALEMLIWRWKFENYYGGPNIRT